MPTFAGNLGPDIDSITDTVTSANLSITRTYAWNSIGADEPPAFTSTRAGTNVQPNFGTRTGNSGLDFGNDWYFRIHILPNALDLGNLVSTQSRTVSLWNAFLAPVAYNALETSGLDGITLVPPAGVTPPTTLAELQFITYGLTIDLSGPPTVNASLTFTIGTDEYVVPITGRRVVLMPFGPNWSSGVEETLTFQTAVSRSWDGTEQRRSLRRTPRRRMGYTAVLSRSEVQRLDNLLYGWQGRLYAVPLWAEPTSLQSSVSLGGDTLTIETANKTFAAGGLLALYLNSGVSEVREILSVTGSTVVLRSPVTRFWDAGTRVYPAMVAALATDVTARRLTESVVETSLSFDAEPSSNKYPFTAGPNPASYQGEELYLHYANWAGGIETTWTTDRLNVDQNSGQFRLVSRSGYSTPTKSHNWTLNGHAQIADFREWLQRREGRAKPFYAPTGYVDFTLAAPAGLNDNAIDVLANDYDLFSPAASLRRDIAIQLKNGTTITRRITAANPNPDTSVKLQLDAIVGVPFTQADVKRISLLQFYRLASDEISFRWLAEGVAQVQAGFTATKT